MLPKLLPYFPTFFFSFGDEINISMNASIFIDLSVSYFNLLNQCLEIVVIFWPPYNSMRDIFRWLFPSLSIFSACYERKPQINCFRNHNHTDSILYRVQETLEWFYFLCPSLYICKCKWIIACFLYFFLFHR